MRKCIDDVRSKCLTSLKWERSAWLVECTRVKSMCRSRERPEWTDTGGEYLNGQVMNIRQEEGLNRVELCNGFPVYGRRNLRSDRD